MTHKLADLIETAKLDPEFRYPIVSLVVESAYEKEYPTHRIRMFTLIHNEERNRIMPVVKKWDIPKNSDIFALIDRARSDFNRVCETAQKLGVFNGLSSIKEPYYIKKML